MPILSGKVTPRSAGLRLLQALKRRAIRTTGACRPPGYGRLGQRYSGKALDGLGSDPHRPRED
ncbi:MAG: hypothetical protein MZU95_07640 [Desulfomicrobium escambiense]|nr:hypothetical protein [Desulfomicrobium escambiense]